MCGYLLQMDRISVQLSCDRFKPSRDINFRNDYGKNVSKIILNMYHMLTLSLINRGGVTMFSYNHPPRC